MEINLQEPYTPDKLKALHAGDLVRLTGTVYTARDAAHARMLEDYDRGTPIPFPVEGSAVYYVGPSPARPGAVIGSAGPTSSYRMDKFTPRLLDMGLKVIIGKGPRGQAVVEALKRNGAVYLAAIGGCGALISQCIKSSEMVAYDDLGTEAIRRLTVEDMPLIVAIDSTGACALAQV
jgi:fumarate hydratase subunit beta